jgi:hypothetical protein
MRLKRSECMALAVALLLCWGARIQRADSAPREYDWPKGGQSAVALAPTPSATAQVVRASADLPDLLPDPPPRYWEDTSDPCVLTWIVGLIVYVSNQGGADAGPFEFTLNKTPYAAPDGLPRGQTYELRVRGGWGSYDIVVDSRNQVVESDEENNRLVGGLPQVTPRLTCTPTPTPTPSVRFLRFPILLASR